MTELEKMKNNLPYNAVAPDIMEVQNKAAELVYRFNASGDAGERNEILKELVGQSSDMMAVSPGFRCDFGFNIYFKGLAVINYNCVFLDTSRIELGENVFMGPGTVVSCAAHPILAEQRNEGTMISKPITIGNNVWIGANCTILGGVNIGENTIIGAGSVVTRDIPANVIAVGSPCRVVREITEEDRMNL